MLTIIHNPPTSLKCFFINIISHTNQLVRRIFSLLQRNTLSLILFILIFPMKRIENAYQQLV